MARPSEAHEAGNSSLAIPPPVTYSWTNTVRIIPVLDVKDGVAVHARGGDRAHYRPVRSNLHEGADPIAMARAYRDRLGLESVYVADLDAIGGLAPNLGLARAIADLGIALWIDAGVRDEDDAGPLFEGGATAVIAGLETLSGPQALDRLLARFGPDRVVFSLDLRDNCPLVATAESWGTDDPREIVDRSRAARLIVLDLARVGAGEGVGTLPLIAAIRGAHPAAEIIAGGGIAGREDLLALEEAGASAALVGSALHDGRWAR